MKRFNLLVILLLLASGRNATAQDAVEKVLRELPGEHRVVGKPQKSSTTILEITDPKLTTALFGIIGEVEYEGVQGSGMLEMLCFFPDGQSYFSRTASPSNPEGDLKGSSARQSFSLPFRSNRGAFPSSIKVNVILSGAGTVKVSGMKLVELNRLATHASWWDNGRGGRIGGILGSLLGLIGGLIGILNAWQHTRPAALALAIIATVMSFVVLVVGLAALMAGQPYHVWYPLQLIGVLGTGVFGSSIWIIRKRCAEYELRKMSAMDAAG